MLFRGCISRSKKSFFKGSYLSFRIELQSYGTNDHVGFGGGVEFSKDLKKWLGVGVNISYWSNDDYILSILLQEKDFDIMVRSQNLR